MKLSALLLTLSFALITLSGCAQAQGSWPTRSTAGPAPTNLTGLKVATFAGGCFWCQEEVFEELKGVRAVVSGYAGGSETNPTYEEVGSGETHHAESVQIYYDPKQITYQALLDVFFTASHDPTTANRQGPDVGAQYRSVAFYRTPEEKAAIEATIRRVDAAKEYRRPIVTQVTAFTTFWPAEGYHQGYYRLHPDNGYIQAESRPKVENVRKAFPQLLKSPL